MSDSILVSIKKMLGISEDYTSFDQDIIININSAISTLNQLGAVINSGLIVSDSSSIWSELIPSGNNLEFIKTYIYLKVKLVFDPPSGASLLDAYQQQIKELEWRINVAAEETKG